MDNSIKLSAILAAFYATDDNSFAVTASMLERISRYKASFAALPAQQKVVLFHPDTEQFFALLMALSNSSVNIILPPNDKPHTLQGTIDADTLLCGEFEDLDPALATRLLDYNKVLESAVDDTLVWPSPSQQDNCSDITFFTSGSSGEAKAIVKSWQALNDEIAILEATFSFVNQAHVFAMVSHQHIYGLLFKLLWPIRFSHPLDWRMHAYPEHLIEPISKSKRAVLIASPAQLTRLAKDNVLAPYKNNLAGIFSSGGPLSDGDAVTLYGQLDVPVTQVYGSTETGGIGFRAVTTSAPTPWRCFQGTRIECEGPQARVFSPLLNEPFQLDDAIELIGDAQFILKGRTDRTVKVAEKRVNLVEYEQHLNQHPLIDNCVVVQLSNGRLGVMAVLSESGQSMLSEQQKPNIIQALREWLLARYEAVCVARKWRFVEALPYNSQGKLIYSQLEQFFVS